jgi:hypothetical protein
VNVPTGEFRALTEQVERLTVIVREDQRVLIRVLDRLLGDDGPVSDLPVRKTPRRGENLTPESDSRNRRLRAIDD